MTQVATVTIQAAQVSADLTDFPLLVNLADMPAGFWSTVANGGGDIRVFKADGTTELPREVVSCDTVTDTGELWIKFTGVLSSSTDTEVQVHADGISADYLHTDPFGRNAVWSDELYVWHLRGTSAADSTGTAGLTYYSNLPNPTGIGQLYDGVGDYASPGALVMPIGSAFSFRARVKPVAEARIMSVLGSDDSIGGVRNFQFRLNPGKDLNLIRFNGSSSVVTNIASTGLVSTVAPSSIAATFDNTVGSKLYINGSQDGSDAVTTTNSARNVAVGVGARINNNGAAVAEPFEGELGIVHIRASALSADWLSTEYNNQSAPATFYTVAAVTVGVTLTSITPTTGPATGGTTVTIYGSGFLSGTPEPRFNGVLATDVVVVNDTELTCVTPAL